MASLGRAFLALAVLSAASALALAGTSREAYAQTPEPDRTIIVNKDCQPAGAEDAEGEFLITLLDGDSNPAVVEGNNPFQVGCDENATFVLQDGEEGTYAATEEVLEGNFPDEPAANGCTGLVIPAELDQGPLECTILNTELPPTFELTVVKACLPEDLGGGYDFSLSGVLLEEPLETEEPVQCGGSWDLTGLAAGVYNLAETTPQVGFTTFVHCGGFWQEAQQVNVLAGLTTECTFVNIDPAQDPTVDGTTGALIVVNTTVIVENTNVNNNENNNTNTQDQTNNQSQVNDNNQQTEVNANPDQSQTVNSSPSQTQTGGDVTLNAGDNKPQVVQNIKPPSTGSGGLAPDSSGGGLPVAVLMAGVLAVAGRAGVIVLRAVRA